MSNRTALALAIAIALPALALTACGGENGSHRESGSGTESLTGTSKKNGTNLTLFSTVAPGGGTTAADPARCYYFLETTERVDARAAAAHRRLALLHDAPVRDSDVRAALEKVARANLGTIVISGAGAAGSCSGAIAGAVATIGSLLGPGTQVVSPGAAALTVASLIGCGVSAKAAGDALWSAWMFNDLKKELPRTDLVSDSVKKPEASMRALVQAIDTAKFRSVDALSCAAKPVAAR